MRTDDGALDLAADWGGRKNAPLPRDVSDAMEQSPDTASMYESIGTEGASVLLIPTLSHELVNGAVCLARDNDGDDHDDDQRDMLAGIAGHIGIAIEQIANVLKLGSDCQSREIASGVANASPVLRLGRTTVGHLNRYRGERR